MLRAVSPLHDDHLKRWSVLNVVVRELKVMTVHRVTLSFAKTKV